MTSPAVPRKLYNPYEFHPSEVRDPPQRLGATLRRIGPGMILASSIVGSGELIATTLLGAQEGYVLLWIIVLSCLIKPVVQGELGRYSIATGQTGLEGFNQLPGPRWRVNWVVYAWAFMVLMTLLQIAGMFGGVSQ